MKSRLPFVPVAALSILAATVFISPSVLPSFRYCWFKSMTGVPCPGCGVTHALCAIGHGRFADAWAYNPFSFAVYGLLLGAAADLFLGGRLTRSSGGALWAPVFVAALYAAWLLRFVS